MAGVNQRIFILIMWFSMYLENSDEIVDIDDLDERDAQEEAKANFKLASQANYNRPMFDNPPEEKKPDIYVPLIGEVLNDDDLHEANRPTSLGRKGGA